MGLPGSAPEKKVRLEESGGGIFTEGRWEGLERWVLEDDEWRKVCVEEEGGDVRRCALQDTWQARDQPAH